MSNQHPRPFVSRDEYERNKNTIANYRAYLNMYENMNEQGLQNNAELERVEHMLQEQVRQGEEAKRQLGLLRHHGTRRIAGGQTTIPEMNVTVPNVQPVASSAYIEEIPEHRGPTNANHSDYVPHSVPKHTPAPQPVYYNHQLQQPSNASTFPGSHYVQHTSPVQQYVPAPPQHGPIPPQHGPTSPLHVPTPPQPTVQAVPNLVQHPQGYQIGSTTSQQTYSRNPQQTYVRPQQSRQMQPTLTPAQLEQYRQLQQQKEMTRQATNTQLYNALPPRYFPPQGNTATNRASTQNQVTTHVGQQGQAVLHNLTSMSNGQTQQRPTETVAQVQTPVNVAIREEPPASLALTNTVVTPASSLADALKPFQQKIQQKSDNVPESLSVQTNASIQPTAPQDTSPTLITSTVKSDLLEACSPSSSINAVPQATPTISATPARPNNKSSSIMEVHNLLSPPMRTPKEADKKHLARDILRALKRPRSETSIIQGPEPKRHALEATTVNPAVITRPPSQISSTPSSATIRPSPSTSAPFPPNPTPTIATPQISVQSSAPSNVTATHNSPHHIPPAPTNPASATQFAMSKTQQIAATPAASSSTPTQAQPTNTGNGASIPIVVQKYPNPLGAQSLTVQTLAKINQATSFGRSPGSIQYAALFEGGSASAKPPLLKPRHTDRVEVAPIAREPLQTTLPMRTPDEPGPSNNPPSVVEAEPQTPSVVPTPAPPVTDALAPTPIPVSRTSPALTVTIQEGSDSATVMGFSVAPSSDEAPGKVQPPSASPLTNKTPLFLPSPTASPNPGTTSGETKEVAEIVLTGEKDKGKAKADVPPSSLSPSLPSVVVAANKELEASRSVFAYVLVPPLPDYAKRWKRQRTSDDDLDTAEQDSGDLGVAGQSRSPSLGDYAGPPRSPSVSSAPPEVVNLVDDEESGSDMVEEFNWNLHFASYDDNAEKEVLLENSVILRESPCKWRGCEFVLNSPGALIRHFDAVHGPRRINVESPWTCRWIGCGYTSISREDYCQHVERHAMYPLWCPFTDCNEIFRTARQLIRHKRSDHSNDLTKRRTAEPSTIKNSSPPSIPSMMPKILPAYIIEYSSIQPASITRYRHEALMPSVLRRISGNVPIQLHSYNAARPMPTTPSGKNILDAPPPANTPYSFLENRSTRYSSYLSSPAKSRNFQELSSSYTTNLVKRGLVLWPEREGDAIQDDMIEELEGMEEDAVERELLDGDEEGVDVFGPTIKIETPRSGAGSGDVGGDVGGDRSGGGRSRSPTGGRTPLQLSTKK